MLYENEEQRDERYMRMALEEARQAAETGEVPVGAIVVAPDGSVAGRGRNMTERLRDVTAHAEMQAITAAALTLGGKYLANCTLYVTVEPCTMCAGAIGWAQVPRVVWGLSDPRRGYSHICDVCGAASPLHPKATITMGVLEDESRELMQRFFKDKRK